MRRIYIIAVVCITLGPSAMTLGPITSLQYSSIVFKYHYSTLQQYVPWYIMEPNALFVSITNEEQSGCDATPLFIVDRKEATAYPNGQDGKDKTDDCEQGNDNQAASVTPSIRHIVGVAVGLYSVRV